MVFDQKILKYDFSKYPFSEIISKILNTENLENLHKYSSVPSKINELGKDTNTDAHKTFYQFINKKNNEFLNIYYKFVFDVLFEQFDENILFQKTPGLRISYPNNVAVSTWHSDSDRNNMHPQGEINVFLPLTNCFGNNSLWIESKPGLKDYHPIRLSVGELLIFNGSECVHGNYKNDTLITRASLDFRLLPSNKYNPNNKVQTATMNLSFTIGEYYADKQLILNQ